MIKVEHIKVFNLEGAVRGMRNPMNSWDKSDSSVNSDTYGFILGESDLKLMRNLYKAGPEHAKFMRQIFVSMDITAPLYWWKEFDTYKVGTVANSCSTMHKIHAKEFVLDDFSHEHLTADSRLQLQLQIDYLNHCREQFLETKDKTYWWQMIQLLPSSYNQKRTITMSYANASNIKNQRKGHKLDDWNILIYIFDTYLPYFAEITQKQV